MFKTIYVDKGASVDYKEAGSGTDVYVGFMLVNQRHLLPQGRMPVKLRLEFRTYSNGDKEPVSRGTGARWWRVDKLLDRGDDGTDYMLLTNGYSSAVICMHSWTLILPAKRGWLRWTVVSP